MATIAIEKTDLIGAEQMAAFLECRMAEIIWLDVANWPAKVALPVNTIDSYVCSQKYASAKGGVPAVVEIARFDILVGGLYSSNEMSFRGFMWMFSKNVQNDL